MADVDRAIADRDGASGPATLRLPQPLMVLVGPTASGKSDLAMDIAERCGGEIVSADSVQVYRHFDIGSGKPSAEDRQRVAHHLVDEWDPLDDVDAARYAARARSVIERVAATGKRPILCGGTFLWVRATLFGLAPMPAANEEIRLRHRRLVEEHGNAALHQQLAEVDAPAFEKLNPNDFVRVSRALEVYELTGRSMSDLQQEHGFREPLVPHRLVGVRRERDELDARIAERVRGMFRRGWVEEVRDLVSRGYADARAMGAVGYRQVRDAVLAGSAVDEDVLVEGISRATRVFARRQRTWLRDEPVRWVSPNDVDAALGDD